MEKAIDRQRILLGHLEPAAGSNPAASAISASACAAYHRGACFADDVVIVAAYRTAICKAKRGGFKDTLPEDLLVPVFKALVDKTKLDPSEIGDIVVGTVLAPGSQRAIECRMAALYAGFPDTVPLKTVNRQCSSGLQAVADVASAIKAGMYDIGIAAGLESMTVNQVRIDGQVNPKVSQMGGQCNKTVRLVEYLPHLGHSIACQYIGILQSITITPSHNGRYATITTSHNGRYANNNSTIYGNQ